MASLQKCVRESKEELRDGIAWVAFYKKGRSWGVYSFFTDITSGEKIEAEEAKEILWQDKKAVLINGYYCGWMGDGTISDLVDGVKAHYENSTYLLSDYVNISIQG